MMGSTGIVAACVRTKVRFCMRSCENVRLCRQSYGVVPSRRSADAGSARVDRRLGDLLAGCCPAWSRQAKKAGIASTSAGRQHEQRHLGADVFERLRLKVRRTHPRLDGAEWMLDCV